MANDKTIGTTTTNRTTSTEKTGLVLGVAALAIDAGDKSASTALGLAQDVRGELRVAVDGGIDAVENIVRGAFRLGKRATARIDDLAAELLGAGERTAAGVFRGLRETTRAAGELAATAAGAVIGGDKAAVAQA